MSKRGKPKKEPEPTTSLITLESKVEAMNNLLMNTLNDIQTMKQQLQNLSTNFTFHTHDMVMRTGASEFNAQLYQQWVEQQKARQEAAEKEKKPE